MQPNSVYCSKCGAKNSSHAKFCYRCEHVIQPEHSLHATMTDTGKIEPGHVLKERYEIAYLVDKGGMGAIYKAKDLTFDGRAVAIKEMSQSKLQQQEIAQATKMFENEAKMLANLNHPNLPSIHDYFGESGRWYLVMDFIEGTTLDKHLEQAPNHILSLQQTLDIGIQLAKVLGYLHNRPSPIIFRDLKPLNIMITPDNNVYLIDFGIARHFTPGKTKDTVYFVSHGYAAPEQYGSAQTSPQSDIYSLGVIFHQILSGHQPSSDALPPKFRPLQSYNRNVPLELSNLVVTMVSTHAAQRPASMALIKQKLEQIQMQVKQEDHQSLHGISGRSNISNFSSSIIDDSDEFDDEPDGISLMPRSTPSIQGRMPSRPSYAKDEYEAEYDDDMESLNTHFTDITATRHSIPSRFASSMAKDEYSISVPERLPTRQHSYIRTRSASRIPVPERRHNRPQSRASRIAIPTLPENGFQNSMAIGIFAGAAVFLANMLNLSITISFHLPWLLRFDIIPILLLLIAGILTGLVAVARSLGFVTGAIAGTLFIVLAFLFEPTKNSLLMPLPVSVFIFFLAGGFIGFIGALLATLWHPYYKDS